MGSIGYQDTGHLHHDPNVMPSLAPPLPRYAPEHVAEEDRYEVMIAGVSLGHDLYDSLWQIMLGETRRRMADWLWSIGWPSWNAA